MSDEPDDDSDWLASQFDATQQLPSQAVPPAQQPVPGPVPAAPPQPAAPPAQAAPPAPAPVQHPGPPASAPPASAPEPTAAGGFNWGLRPSSAVVPPPTPSPVAPPEPVATPSPVAPPEPVAPPALVVPPEPVAPPIPQPVSPPTEPYVSEPTRPLSWNEFAATQQQSTTPPAVEPAFPAALAGSPLDQPTEAYTVQPWQPAAVSPTLPVEPVDQADQADQAHDSTSAIDALFGDHKFQEYEDVGVLQTLQPVSVAEAAPLERQPRGPLPTSQKVLMGIAAGLIGILILIGGFFLGEHIGSAQAAEPKPTKPGSSATPTPAGTGGPAAPGVQQWTALQGGECIQPFSSAWAQTFTVVACTADHDAEMIFKGKLPDPSSAAYPTATSFQKQLTALCSAPTAINYAAAAAVTDLQVSFSYPPNTAAWLAGDRTYYCFVDRVSGGNLPGDLAVAKPAAGN